MIHSGATARDVATHLDHPESNTVGCPVSSCTNNDGDVPAPPIQEEPETGAKDGSTGSPTLARLPPDDQGDLESFINLPNFV